MPEYKGEERREICGGCIKDDFLKLMGARTVEKWLVRILVVVALGGGWYSNTTVIAANSANAEQAQQIALNSAAIADLKVLAQQNITIRREQEKDRDRQTAKILSAIKASVK